MNYLLFFLNFVFVTFVFASDTMFDIGKTMYRDTCISCHGDHGKANTKMNLIVKPRDLTKTILTEKQTYLITKDGAHHWGAKADIMPAFKYVYNEKQLRAVSHYISKQFNPNVHKKIEMLCSKCDKPAINQDKKMKKWGKKIWKRNCSWCHGPTGHGNGVATKNPVDSIYPYDLTKTLLTRQQIFLYTKFGGHYFGTYKTDMPSWKKKYDDFKLHSIARYVDEIIRKKGLK